MSILAHAYPRAMLAIPSFIDAIWSLAGMLPPKVVRTLSQDGKTLACRVASHRFARS